jgi:DNA invertase Pin-like site-specific DNA recombinase
VKTAYSYIRFSTRKQAGGDSLARQTASTADYCERVGLVLDDRLRLEDLGVSAFRGKNLEEGGALARFLEAVRAGHVEPGSALIIESLDRLSRQTPRRALALLTQILEAGVEVHLTATGKVFLPANEDGIDLILAVAEAMRGHEESAKKSMRLKSAFASKRAKAVAGEKIRVQGMLPWWLEVAPDKSIICREENAVILTRIFQMMAAGASSIKISNTLNAEPGNPRRWLPATICRLIKSDAPIGILRTPVFKTEGYYPSIIPPDLAAEARAMLQKNSLVEIGRRPKPGRLPNVLKGLLRYARTQTPLSLHWVQFKSKQTGYYTARDTSCNLFCRFNADQVEGVLISALAELTPAATQLEKNTAGNGKQTRLEKQISALDVKIKNLVEAVESGSTSLAKRLVEIEGERATLCDALETVKLEAPRAFEPAALEACKYFEFADLRNAARREELSIALRKLISIIQIGRGLAEIGISQGDDAKFKNVMFYDDCEITDLTPSRCRCEIAMLVTFRTGAKRLIWRDAAARPIFGLRID